MACFLIQVDADAPSLWLYAPVRAFRDTTEAAALGKFAGRTEAFRDIKGE